ncbi:MAG: M20 family metallo-hydrolase [Candidatus Methanomethylophilaceae archaeon]|nr:M20 family metallo-hydrolase [Candidatus Methanomethylophilaceae archaeon]
MDLEGIIRSVESSEERMVSDMCGMIRIPAMSPVNGGDGECARADFLQGILEGFDTVERFDTDDREHPGIRRANIVARKKGKKKGTVWFIAHMDTVPVGDLDDWESDPFSARVADGRIYGRGTEDNGQSLIGVAAVSRIVCKEQLEGMSLGVAIVADEETGSVYGVKHLIDSGVFSEDDFIIVPDWGSPGGAMVDVSEKQILWIKAEITGKQTHGSTPSKGINAFRAGTQFLADLMSRLEERYPKKDPIFRPEASTFEPTKASANDCSVNTIPGYYEFYMDCRVLLDYDIDEIFTFMESVAKEHSEMTGASIVLKKEQSNISGKPSDPSTEGYRRFAESIKQARGIDVDAVGIGGGTCANFFRLKGMNAYVWGSDGGTLHQPNEYVVIRTMVEDAKAFAAMMYNMCVRP